MRLRVGTDRMSRIKDETSLYFYCLVLLFTLSLSSHTVYLLFFFERKFMHCLEGREWLQLDGTGALKEPVVARAAAPASWSHIYTCPNC